MMGWEELRAALELLGVPLFVGTDPGVSLSRRYISGVEYYTWINCSAAGRFGGPDELRLQAGSQQELIELCYSRAIEIAQARSKP